MTSLIRSGLPALAVTMLFSATSAEAAVKCASAPSVIVSDKGKTDVFVVGSDGKAYQRTYGKDGKWVDLGGKCRYGISATSRKSGVDLFTVAQSGHLVHRAFNKDTGWGADWADVGATPGGKCISQPAAVTSPSGRIDVFVVGADNKMHQAILDGREWKWSSLGGECKHGPGATTRLGRIELLTVAQSGNLVRKTFNKEWSKEWADLGAPEKQKVTLAPAVALSPTGNLHAFIVGDDHKAYHLSSDGTKMNWAEMGGDCRQGIAAASYMNRLQVFTVAKSGHLVRRTFNKEWSKDWADLGQPAD